MELSTVNSIKDYFHTDWGAMTQHDWIGLLMTIVVFIIMVVLYTYVFHPSNRERLESYRHIPFDDEPGFSNQTPEHVSENSNENSSKSDGPEDKK